MSSVEVFDARIAPGLAILSISREDLLLQRHAFEHRFDDHVRLVEAVVGQRGLDQRHPLIHLLLREAAFLHGVVVVLADGRQSAVERRLVRLLQQHRDAGVGEDHGDAAAHGAGADDRRPCSTGITGVSLRMSGIFDTSRSPKKTWISAFDWSENRHSVEQLRFHLAAFVERQRRGGFDGVDGSLGRDQVADFLPACRARRRRSARSPPPCRAFRCARAFSEPAALAHRGQRLPRLRADRPR